MLAKQSSRDGVCSCQSTPTVTRGPDMDCSQPVEGLLDQSHLALEQRAVDTLDINRVGDDGGGPTVSDGSVDRVSERLGVLGSNQ